MKLYTSLTSPYGRKARVMLAEKRIDFELVLTDVWDSNSDLEKFNPLGKVPCLVLDDGNALYDSPVIIDYLDSVTPVGHLIPETTRQRIQVKRWEALADGVTDAAVAIVLEKKRAPQLQSTDWITRQSGKIERGIKVMSQDLGENTWCTGHSFNLSDIVVGCALMYLDFRFAEVDWRKNYPNLGQLTDKLAKRNSFKNTEPPTS